MDLSSYAQKVRGNLQSLFFPSSSSSFILYDVARDKRGDTKDFEASNTTTQKRVVDFDAKQQKLEFSSSFVSSQRVSRFAKRKRTHNAHHWWMVSQ